MSDDKLSREAFKWKHLSAGGSEILEFINPGGFMKIAWNDAGMLAEPDHSASSVLLEGLELHPENDQLCTDIT